MSTHALHFFFPMTYQPSFKQTFVDFVVEEHLPYPLAKRGTRYYVKLEKRNMNTMDMVKKIMKTFSLTRKKIGIWWLKDKHALATQRVCFHSNDVKKIGEQLFLNWLGTIARVITTWFSEIPLGLQTPITNEFWIRLKHQNTVATEQKQLLEKKFTQLMQEWFPNYFGEQRFGVTANNHRIAQDILEGGRKHFSQSEKMFKLQWYASWLFNKYLEQRLKIYKDIRLLDGDLLVDPQNPKTYLLYTATPTPQWSLVSSWKEQWFFTHATPQGTCIPPESIRKDMITWPLVGYNTLLNPESTESGKYESGRRKHFELTEEHLHLYKPYKLFWLRRSLRVMPTDHDFKRQGNDLLLHFTLPKSAYASVVVDMLIEKE